MGLAFSISSHTAWQKALCEKWYEVSQQTTKTTINNHEEFLEITKRDKKPAPFR